MRPDHVLDRLTLAASLAECRRKIAVAEVGMHLSLDPGAREMATATRDMLRAKRSYIKAQMTSLRIAERATSPPSC